jgi:hypothetical protein
VSKRFVTNVVTDKLDLKKLNEEEVEEQCQVTNKTDFQPWKSYRIMRISIRYGALLERI